MYKTGMSITNSHPTQPTIEEQIALYARIGFDSFFLATGVTEEYYKIPHWSEIAATQGIRFEAVHGPTGGANELWAGKCDGYFAHICRIVDWCREGQVEKLVLHGAHGMPPPVSPAGLTAFDRLEGYAEEAGVRLLWENSNVTEHFLALATRQSTTKNGFHGVCLDVGHHQCYSPDLPWQKLVGDRVKYTHLHDNIGIPAGASVGPDLHLLPFDGVRDWDKLVVDLVSCGYKGTWNLELSCNGDVRYREMAYEKFAEEAYVRVRRLVERAERL